MREEIESLGGEVRFQQQVTELLIEDGQIGGVVLANGAKLLADHVVLALGHSARDTFRMLCNAASLLRPNHFQSASASNIRSR